MATIRKEVALKAGADAVWDAVRDFHNLHERLVRGFVVAAKPDADARLITFANGLEVREDLISCDDAGRRLAYTASGGGLLKHHNGVVEVRPVGSGSVLVWTLDILPNEAAPAIDAMMDMGAEAMRQSLGG